MVLDPEAQQRFSELDKDICELKENDKQHAERLRKLEIQYVEHREMLKNVKDSNEEIKDTIKEVKSINLQNQNTLLQMVVSNNDNATKKDIALICNETEKQKSKFDNLTKIFIGILGLTGTIIGTLYAGSKLFS